MCLFIFVLNICCTVSFNFGPKLNIACVLGLISFCTQPLLHSSHPCFCPWMLNPFFRSRSQRVWRMLIYPEKTLASSGKCSELTSSCQNWRYSYFKIGWLKKMPTIFFKWPFAVDVFRKKKPRGNDWWIAVVWLIKIVWRFYKRNLQFAGCSQQPKYTWDKFGTRLAGNLQVEMQLWKCLGVIRWSLLTLCLTV